MGQKDTLRGRQTSRQRVKKVKLEEPDCTFGNNWVTVEKKQQQQLDIILNWLCKI